MSKRSEQIAKLLKSLTAGTMPVFVAEVTSEVDPDNLTIDIVPIGQAELDEVRLKAGVDGIKDGVVEYPKKGSKVLCGIIGNDEDICFVIKCSEVDKVVINGGLQGGLINIETLVQRINVLEDRMTSHQHISAAPASPTTPDVATNPDIDSTTVDDIEDDKVLH